MRHQLVSEADHKNDAYVVINQLSKSGDDEISLLGGGEIVSNWEAAC